MTLPEARSTTPAAGRPPRRRRPRGAGRGRPAPSARHPWQTGRQTRLALAGVALLAGGLFFWSVRSILGPFIVAGILTYALNPLVTAITRRTGLHRAAALAGIYAFLGVGVAWLILVVLPVGVREAHGLAVTLPRLAVELRRTLAAQAPPNVLGFEVSVAPLADELSRSLSTLAAGASNRLVMTVVATVETVFKAILTLVVTFYLLADAPRLGPSLRAAFPPAVSREWGPVLMEADRVMGRFIRGQLILVAIMSLATWVALTVLGVHYALLLGLVAGVLELIPFVGPILAAAPAVALAFLYPSPYGWSPAVVAGAVALTYLILRHAEDYLVIPLVVGRAVALHPLVAMFATFSGAAIGGVLGLVLGIPVAGVLRVVGRHALRQLFGPPAPVVPPPAPRRRARPLAAPPPPTPATPATPATPDPAAQQLPVASGRAPASPPSRPAPLL